MLNKVASTTIFWVFGMTGPGIKSQVSPSYWRTHALSLSPRLSVTLSLSLSLYIYIYIYNQIPLLERISMTLSACLLVNILCPGRDVVGMFLLVGQHWHVYMKGSMGKHYLLVRPSSTSSVTHALFVLFGWF